MASAKTKRNPGRRNVGITLLIVVVGYLAWRATQVIWFQGAFLEKKKWQWVGLDPNTLATYGIVPTPTGSMPAMYTVFGYPAPVVWTAVAVAFAVLALITRMGLLALAGAGAAWMARTAVTATQATLMSTEELQQRFATTGSGMLQFLDWTWVLIGLLILSAAQITYANHVRRRAQEAAGEEVEPNLLDTFHAVQASAVSRLAADRSKGSASPAAKTETTSSS